MWLIVEAIGKERFESDHGLYERVSVYERGGLRVHDRSVANGRGYLWAVSVTEEGLLTADWGLRRRSCVERGLRSGGRERGWDSEVVAWATTRVPEIAVVREELLGGLMKAARQREEKYIRNRTRHSMCSIPSLSPAPLFPSQVTFLRT